MTFLSIIAWLVFITYPFLLGFAIYGVETNPRLVYKPNKIFIGVLCWVIAGGYLFG